LLAGELGDEAWVARRSPAEVFREAERGLTLTDELNRHWETVISRDRTGWFLSLRIEKNVEAAWAGFVAPVRNGVLAEYESGLDIAFDRLTERLLEKQPKREVAAYWKAQIDEHPKLARWAATQAYLLENGPGDNLLANGGFEQGSPGSPPTLPGWTLRGAWQGVQTEFVWKPDAGSTGRALAVGKGRIGEIGAAVRSGPGRRYRLSLSYKTCADLNPAASVFLHGLPAGRLPLTRTGGEWRQWSTTFTSPKTRATIMLEVKGVDQGKHVWFDDVELVQIGADEFEV
jgi:hypothetical protein